MAMRPMFSPSEACRSESGNCPPKKGAECGGRGKVGEHQKNSEIKERRELFLLLLLLWLLLMLSLLLLILLLLLFNQNLWMINPNNPNNPNKVLERESERKRKRK
jgi:hypothetical protein